MVIGLQITKNKDKYKKLVSLIDASNLNNISFVHIENDNSLKKFLKKIDVLVTYKITPDLFNYRSENLKWIHIGASGIEENLFEDLRDNEALEHGLAEAIVKELGTDTTDYTEESLDGVLVSYIMEQLSNRISQEIANMNYIVKVSSSSFECQQYTGIK